MVENNTLDAAKAETHTEQGEWFCGAGVRRRKEQRRVGLQAGAGRDRISVFGYLNSVQKANGQLSKSKMVRVGGRREWHYWLWFAKVPLAGETGVAWSWGGVLTRRLSCDPGGWDGGRIRAVVARMPRKGWRWVGVSAFNSRAPVE